MNDHTEGGKYRMLKKGEIIEAGDEMKGNFRQWVPVHPAALGAELFEVNVGRFRRPVTQEYRMLKHREIIISGDERKNTEGQWVPVGRPALGTGLHELNVGRFRRPVAQEYRMLKKGEVRQEGDEYLSKDGTWHPTKHPGSYVFERSVGRIRRPVTQETVVGPDGGAIGWPNDNGSFVVGPDNANDGVTEASTPARPQLPFANRDEAVNCLVREVFGAEPVYADEPPSVANEPDLGERLGPVAVSTLETHACDAPPPSSNATRDDILFHLDRIINQGEDSDVRSGYTPDALWLEEVRQMIFKLEHHRRQLHSALTQASYRISHIPLRYNIDTLLKAIEPS